MLVPYHFHLTNHSSHDLLGLQLDVTPCNLSLRTCTLVRERGSLTLEAPSSPVIIGNLYAEECFTLYCTFQENAIHFTPDVLLTCLSVPEDSFALQPLGVLSDYLTITSDDFSDT